MTGNIALNLDGTLARSRSEAAHVLIQVMLWIVSHGVLDELMYLVGNNGILFVKKE